MWKNCYEWRKTTEGVGIDELYRRTDPFDVRLIIPSVWELLADDSCSILNETMSSNSGRYSSIR